MARVFMDWTPAFLPKTSMELKALIPNVENQITN